MKILESKTAELATKWMDVDKIQNALQKGFSMNRFNKQRGALRTNRIRHDLPFSATEQLLDPSRLDRSEWSNYWANHSAYDSLAFNTASEV